MVRDIPSVTRYALGGWGRVGSERERTRGSCGG